MDIMILRIWNDAGTEYWSAHCEYETLEGYLLSYIQNNGNQEDFEGLPPGQTIAKFFDLMEDNTWYEVKTVNLVGFQNAAAAAPEADTVFLTERELIIARKSLQLADAPRMRQELILPGQSVGNMNKEIVEVYEKLKP